MSESSEYHINRVGLKRPNAFGIYDMHGNADEWCLDEFARKLPGGTNPLVERGDSAPIHVVSRGSSGSIGRSRTGDLDLTRFTSAGRGIATPGQKSVLGGFRVVRVP